MRVPNGSCPMRGEHRGAAHDLDPARDGDVVGAGDDALGGEVGRLLARAALPVDRGGRDRLGEPGGEHRVAGDVEGLLAGLRHAAADDVVDLARVDPGPLDQRRRVSASRSTGCQPDSAPPGLPLPTGVRTASTITASRTGGLLQRGRHGRIGRVTRGDAGRVSPRVTGPRARTSGRGRPAARATTGWWTDWSGRGRDGCLERAWCRRSPVVGSFPGQTDGATRDVT
jgi:hypothetical protein